MAVSRAKNGINHVVLLINQQSIGANVYRKAGIGKSALIKIHVGPDVAKSMNQTARDWLQYNAQQPMNRLAQTFSSHPFLARRLSHIDWHAASFVPTAAPMPPVSAEV